MEGNLIINEASKSLNDFLEDSYESLLKSVEIDGYILEYQDFDYFQEIVCGGEVVGFLTFQKLDLLNSVAINECYIDSAYRESRLLYSYLMDLIQNPKYLIYIRKPNRSFISALLKYGLAFKMSKNIVLSYIPFVVELKDAYKNSKIKNLYKKLKKEDEDMQYFTDVFDLDLCGVLFKDSFQNYTKKYYTFIVAEPRKSDIKKYNTRKKFKKISNNYLEDADEIVGYETNDAFDYFESIDDKSTVEYIIGTEDELTDSCVEILKENDLTVQDGFKIRKKVVEALDEKEIVPKSIKNRFFFYVSNLRYLYMGIQNSIEEGTCPFCRNKLSDCFIICPYCGYNIDLAREPVIVDPEEEFSFFNDGADSYYYNENFLTQLSDFNDEFNDYFNTDKISEVLDSIKNGEDVDFSALERDDFLSSNDGGWRFEEGNIADNGLLKLIEENDYDLDEVYDVQSRIMTYEYVKHVNEHITSWRVLDLHKLNHILFDEIEYAYDEGYIEKLMPDDYEEYFKKYSLGELKDELQYFGITPKESEEEVLNQFTSQFEFIFIPTAKGIDYLNSHPMMDFFATYLRGFLFFEFEEYYEMCRDEWDLRTIGDNFVNLKLEWAVESEDVKVYLDYLDYYYMVNRDYQDYDEALMYLMQKVIYEVNKWFSVSYFGISFPISFRTANFFNEMLEADYDLDLDEIFDRAFREFQFDEFKNHRQECHKCVMRLLDGDYVVEVNDDLIEESKSSQN